MDKHTILSEYATYAAHQRAQAKARRQEIFERFPQVREQEREYLRLSKELAHRNALGEESAALAEQVEQARAQTNALLAKTLADAGYPKDYLEVHYRCARCRDTGYLGEEKKVLCSCVLERLKRAKPQAVKLHCFSDFDEQRIPQGRQRESAKQLKAYFEEYVQRFEEMEKPNFLLAGLTGLGKTFFLQCVFCGLQERGIGGRFLTAYELNEAFKRQHIQGEPTLKKLVQAPFLAIDDLGTEPIYNNITLEYLFTLLNERAARQKHTGIATNLLDMQQLVERYGERIVSRMTDVRTTRLIALKGEDLRHYRG